MELHMNASFQILKRSKARVYIPANINKKDVFVSVGGFEFVINEKPVRFDFDASSCEEVNGVYSYESGYGPFMNDHSLSDCYDSDLAEMGLTRENLTPEYLASTSKILDFHVLFDDENGCEQEAGWYENADADYIVKLNFITFADANGNEFNVPESVIGKYND